LAAAEFAKQTREPFFRLVLLGLRRRSNILNGRLAMLDRLKSPKLLERAKLAAKQMSYFRLFSQKGSFEGLAASAKRAGFEWHMKMPRVR
jgi:hypothetical protein